jgi:hypothetical protein
MFLLCLAWIFYVLQCLPFVTILKRISQHSWWSVVDVLICILVWFCNALLNLHCIFGWLFLSNQLCTFDNGLFSCSYKFRKLSYELWNFPLLDLCGLFSMLETIYVYMFWCVILLSLLDLCPNLHFTFSFFD